MYIPAYQLTDNMVVIGPSDRQWKLSNIYMTSDSVFATINDHALVWWDAEAMVMVDASSIPVPTGCL